MNRREALLSSGGMMVSAYLGGIACGTKNAVADPQTAGGAAVQAKPGAGHVHGHGDAALASAALDCVHKGEACLAHCIMMLSGGDASMAGCAASVNDMRAAMNALGIIAAHGGKMTNEFAKAAVKFCIDCEMECKKHEAKHVVCKDCADSCRATIAIVAKLS